MHRSSMQFGFGQVQVRDDFGYTTQAEEMKIGWALQRGGAWQARHMGITLSIPHKLNRLEARRRIETGFAKILRQVPGSAGTCSERWDGDRLIFEVGAMGQTVSGVVDVLDDAVRMEIELPGMLGLIAGALKNRLQSAGQLLLK
jgi:hypothetical protein